MVLTSEPEFTPNQGNITEMRNVVQRNRDLWNQSSSAKITVVFFFFFFCKVRQNDCIASMPCNFKSWPAKEITLADQKIRIWWRSYSKCNHLLQAFLSTLHLTPASSARERQPQWACKFSPLYTFFLFFSGWQVTIFIVPAQLKVLSKEMGALYFTGFQLYPILASI